MPSVALALVAVLGSASTMGVANAVANVCCDICIPTIGTALAATLAIAAGMASGQVGSARKMGIWDATFENEAIGTPVTFAYLRIATPWTGVATFIPVATSDGAVEISLLADEDAPDPL